MSSILDALRQLENGGSQPAPDDMPPVESEKSSPWTLLAIAGACVLGIAMGWAFWPRPTPTAPEPGPDASLASGVDLPPAAPAPPPRVRNAEAPRAEMAGRPAQRMAAARKSAARPAPPAATPEAEAAPEEGAAEEAVYAPTDDPSATAGIGRAIPRPRGEPRVRINSLSYSPSPTRRVVSLSVNNSRPVYVREGEKVGGVEVTLIMPDSVYVKHNGNIFSIAR